MKHLNEFEPLKGANSTFKVKDVIDFMIDAVIYGYTHFDHMEQVRKDDSYTSTKQHSAPSEKVCRDILKALPKKACENLRALNKSLLEAQAKHNHPEK